MVLNYICGCVQCEDDAAAAGGGGGDQAAVCLLIYKIKKEKNQFGLTWRSLLRKWIDLFLKLTNRGNMISR